MTEKNGEKQKIFCIMILTIYSTRKDESLYIIIRQKYTSPTSEMKE
jgi:hypothetical protein